MQLFFRRPLCLFCFLFILMSLIAARTSFLQNLIFPSIVIGIMILSVVFCIIFKKCRMRLLHIFLALCFILGAMLNFGLRVDHKRAQVQEYIGKRTAVIQIKQCEYYSDNTCAYTVDIEKISNKDVYVKAVLFCGFNSELDVGDTLRGEFEIMDTEAQIFGMNVSNVNRDNDILLCAVLYQPDTAEVEYFDHSLPLYRAVFEKNGFTVAVNNAKTWLCERIESIFEDSDAGALAKGVLLGDKSDIRPQTVRDFRRSGLSHIFAVSGMHISILLGAVDIFLRKLYVNKYIRCAVIAVLAVPMLILTGFAMSAVRSVFMLWIAYLAFSLSEENDPPTTLFVTVTAILLIYPYAVYDLGMWLSFLATLGLVTVYPELQLIIPKYKSKTKWKKSLFNAPRNILMVAIMTVICSVFVLPLQWYVFGEMSVVSVIANILISPLTAVFMITAIIALLVGSIPIIGGFAVYAAGKVCLFMIGAVETLSSLDFAAVSLKYPFADILITIFIAVMCIMLLIKLRHVLIIGLPMIALTLAFSVCTAVFSYNNAQKLTFYGDGQNELLAISSPQELTLIDMSNGTYSRFSQALDDAARQGATQVERIVFTDITPRHISSMEYFMRSNIVKNVYIPTPVNDDQKQLAMEMSLLANACGTNSYLYKNGESIFHDDIGIAVSILQTDGKRSLSVFVKSSEHMFGYSDIYGGEDYLNTMLSQCDTVLIGNSGGSKKTFEYTIDFNATLIYASDDIRKMSKIDNISGNTYCNTQKRACIEIPLN